MKASCCESIQPALGNTSHVMVFDAGRTPGYEVQCSKDPEKQCVQRYDPHPLGLRKNSRDTFISKIPEQIVDWHMGIEKKQRVKGKKARAA